MQIPIGPSKGRANGSTEAKIKRHKYMFFININFTAEVRGHGGTIEIRPFIS